MALTAKQQRFVEEYLIDLNATQAAIRAGYSEKTARQIASKELTKLDVQEAVAKAMAERSKRTKVTADAVVQELAKIGFANMQDYMRVTPKGDPFIDLSALTRDQAAAIGEVTVEDYKDGRGKGARDVRRVKFKLNDKKSALDSLGRHLGIFTDKTEHTGNVGMLVKWMDPE